MKIYFTRHGETEWNSRDIICGATELPLTERGIAQAEALAEDIGANHRDIDLLICSGMGRALRTASPIADILGLSIHTDPRFREWDYGEFEGKSRFTDGFMENKLEFGCRMPGGESVFDLVNRVYGALDSIIEEYPASTPLIVCHGGVCRVIETYYRNMTVKQFSGFYMGNCELRSFDTELLPYKHKGGIPSRP